MSVTPTKGGGEERWSSGSRWDGGAEGETSAMDGLGGIVQAVDVVRPGGEEEEGWVEKPSWMQKKIQIPRLPCARRPGRRRGAYLALEHLAPSQGPQATP